MEDSFDFMSRVQDKESVAQKYVDLINTYEPVKSHNVLISVELMVLSMDSET